MTLLESLAYTPKELSFGTSGLRGLVRDITHLETYINTRGYLRFLIGAGAVKPGDAVYLAGDLRPSTNQRVASEDGRGEILQGVARAIEDSGLKVVYLGRIPTPALTYHGLRHRAASIMVTGSHIPFDRNGIKFNKPSGELLKVDEVPVLEQVRAVRNEVYGALSTESPFDARGMLKPGESRALPAADPAGSDGYRDRYLRAFPEGVLKGRRLLLYEHSAVGRELLGEILRGLGAEVVAAGRTDTFTPIDTEAVSDRMLEDLQRLLNAQTAGPFDAIVSTDGDSDRPLVLGIEGGVVQFIPGDLLGALTAEFLGARHAAVPISVNDAVDRHLSRRGIAVSKTRIGSPFVIAAMQQVGWEANGGFLTACPLMVPNGGELEPLPTRDAVLPILAILNASFRAGRTVVQHVSQLPARYGRSDLLREVPRETSLRILARFTPSEPNVEQAEFQPWTVIVRRPGSSSTEVAPEPLAAELIARKNGLEDYFSGRDGFGPVQTMNFLDGLRVVFANGDVVHLRPSGNAPELRVYATADTPERATAIARLAIVDGGILRTLEAGTIAGGGTDDFKRFPRPVRVRGTVQHYLWGGFDYLPQLLGRQNSERRPFAELWLGAHPSAPSVVDLDGAWVSLKHLIDTASDVMLGAAVNQSLGPRLPYLFKVLDVRQMLSIQAHPSRSQAQEGFARENAARLPVDAPNRNYRDDNHKPEVHVALTPFWMLHGFRPLEEIGSVLERVEELSTLMPDFPRRLARAGQDASRRATVLRALYETVMTLPQAEIDRMLNVLLARLARESPKDRQSPDYWVLRAAGQSTLPDGHRDRGLISIYLLNLVHLQPGQGTYQPAGVLHAYLEGVNVELMANSDNVLRGGLTPKHVDVPELLRSLLFLGGKPAILQGAPVSETETAYSTAAEEFELSRIDLTPTHPRNQARPRSAECLLVLEGNVSLHSSRRDLDLSRGQAAVIPAALEYTLDVRSGAATLFKAAIPAPISR